MDRFPKEELTVRKIILFVLLLAAVLLIMTACSHATPEPAKTDDHTNIPEVTENPTPPSDEEPEPSVPDDPTMIPGVTEDQNVPPENRMVPASDDDIKAIIEALRSDTSPYKTQEYGEVVQEFMFKVKDGSVHRLEDGTEAAVSGSLLMKMQSFYDVEITEEGFKNESGMTQTLNGVIKCGDDEYVMTDFSINFNQDNWITDISGSFTKNGIELVGIDTEEAFQELLYSSNLAFYIAKAYGGMPESYRMVQILKREYDSETVKGLIAFRSETTDNESTDHVIIADFSKLNDHSLTMKFSATISPNEEKTKLKAENAKFAYASLDGTYFTNDSLVTAENLIHFFIYDLRP